MLGEKRNQSLFAPQASAGESAATHTATGPDGQKKELPLYFGPDCPVSGDAEQSQHGAGTGEFQPADEPLHHVTADDETGVGSDPADHVDMAEELPRRSLNTEPAGGHRAHSLFFTPENEGQDFNTVLQDEMCIRDRGYYSNIGEDGFTEADHIRLRDALMRIEGKFLLSYNDDAFVRRLYDQPGIYLMETTRINNIKQRYDKGAQFPELLIANYDLRERSRMVPSQMTLFDWNGGETIG